MIDDREFEKAHRHMRGEKIYDEIVEEAAQAFAKRLREIMTKDRLKHAKTAKIA